jgi:N6-L-threonylcarbamoyladenine synthase
LSFAFVSGSLTPSIAAPGDYILNPKMIVLGVETSCDETAAALVCDAKTPDERVLAERLFSQHADHRPYGGIVPELAARAHVAHLDRLIQEALAASGLSLGSVDGIAATAGPGLIGGLLVGLTMAKTMACALGKPLIAVNHLEGHALSIRLKEDTPFPYLLLLVSGGHCQLLAVEGVGRYVRLGTTIDDAVGEAFDKAAKLLGLSFPGGPEIERAASAGDARRFLLPRPMRGQPGCDFSFSGLKTALRHKIADLGRQLTQRDVADLAASFQAAVIESISDRTKHAMRLFASLQEGARRLVVAGGVAANAALKASLAEVARAEGFRVSAPPPELCTDNAAMIAWAGIERLKLGLTDPLTVAARARWPLDAQAEPKPYAGVKA